MGDAFNDAAQEIGWQGTLVLTFAGEVHGLSVRVMNLGTGDVKAFANAEQVEGATSKRLDFIHLRLGYKFREQDGFFYKDPALCVEEARPLLADEK